MFRRFITLLLLCTLFAGTLCAESLDEGNSLFQRGTSSYQKGDFSEAYKFLNKSNSIFEEIGQDAREELMGSFLWAGATAYHLENYGEAENLYLKALNLAEMSNNIPYQSNIVTALANLKFALLEYSQSGDWSLKSSELLNKQGAFEEARSAYEYGGYAKTMAEKYDEALEIFQNSIENSPDNRAQSEMAWLYSMRGNSLYYLHNLHGALDDYLFSVSLFEQLKPSPELIHYYGWIGKIYLDSANNEGASEYFYKAMHLAEKIGSDEDQSRMLANLGVLFASTGEYEQAARYYEESMVFAKSLGRTDFLIAAYESLDWIYEEMGNESSQIEIKEQLIPLYLQEGDNLKQANAYNDLGYLFYNRKDYDQSIPLFERSVFIFRDKSQDDDLAISLLNLGMSYEKSGKHELSQKFLNESLSLNLGSGNISDAEDILGHLYAVYYQETEYANLINQMEQFLPIYRAENKLDNLMHLTSNIGVLYYTISDYENAIRFYEKAYDLSIQLENSRVQCITLYNRAQSKAALALYRESFDLYERALLIATEEGIDDLLAEIWNSLGELYRAWGWFEKSLSSYSKAEALFENNHNIDGLAVVSNNTGQALRIGGDAEASIPYYLSALEMVSESDDKEAKAIYLSNLGEAYREIENFESALLYYTQALQIDLDLKNLKGIHIRKNNIALIDLNKGNYKKALETFETCLLYWRKTGNLREESSALKNIWSVYFILEEYETAADYLLQAVEIQEQLRLTATGAVRREFLESQIGAYRNLALTYYYLEDPMNSLYFLELSRGKYLLEQMDIASEDSAYNRETYSDFINGLDDQTLLLSYSLIEQNLFQVLAVERGKVTTTLIQIEEQFLDEIFTQFGSTLSRYIENPEENRLESVLSFYRQLLARPVQSRTTGEAVEYIGAYLYGKLIQPFQSYLEDIQQLILVPDGILGTIPFEVLPDEEGTYLVEKCDIRYSQSLVISQMIRDRKYSQNRKPLLAYGGAVYEEETYREDIEETDVNVIRQYVSEMIKTGSSTRGAYSGLGLGSWKNLPGTLDEVNLLSRIVPGAEIITGADVTEESLMDKSDSGALANYKVIHFATHGIVLPEIPELSAVVLSQFSHGEGREDGYLTMSEIARLDIKADFVNLSACETGLGKVYEGEGVVGLTQAFLVAGANALSVSLWQVSDESTMKFMTGVYSLVEEEGLSYSQAISEMKRVFLKDDLYKNPFYWAPFVHYGENEEHL